MSAEPAPVARGALHGDETLELAHRVVALDESLVVGGGRIEPAVVARVSRTIDGVRERIELGVDQTVVALVGGTGSGKSSLFNAVCGLDFADVGVKRPTTSQITACVWGEDGDPLLDWLTVAEDRRIVRESLLDGDTEAPLRGLVLLDLPDHDSIEPAHREVVDRLLPQADLLVWVVDPQKYADDALHTGYLQRLVGHEAAMVVVLNQIDTVPADVRGDLAADMSRLLVEDGLSGVDVRPVSTVTGEGVAELRDLLAAVVRTRSLAAKRASAEVNDAAALVAAQVGLREPSPTALGVSDVVETLAGAAGLRAVADAVAAVVRGGSRTVPAFGAVQLDAVELARAGWLASVSPGLPRRWSQDVADRVATVAELRLAVADSLTGVGVAARRSGWAVLLVVLSVLVLGAGVLLSSVAVGSLVGGTQEPANGWTLAAGVTLVVLGVVLLVLSGVVRRAAASRRAAAVLRAGRAALEQVALVRLAEPTQAVLGEHRRVRELAASAVR